MDKIPTADTNRGAESQHLVQTLQYSQLIKKSDRALPVSSCSTACLKRRSVGLSLAKVFER